MNRLLLLALLCTACATTQKVSDDDRIDEESDSVSAKREQGGETSPDSRSGAGLFKPVNSGVKSAAEAAAREMKLMRESEKACETEISDTLSDAQLAQLAKDREAAFVKSTGPRVENVAALKELNRVGLAVSKGVASANFGLTESDKPRAFFASTGTVLLTTALVKKCANEAQLAAVLAHEVEHVRARADEAPHVRLLRTQCQTTRVMKELMPQLNVANSMQMMTGVMGGMEAMLRDEDAADVGALKAVSAAGYDPAEYEALVRAVGDTDQDGITSPGGAERRAARLQRDREGLKIGKKPALPKPLSAL